MFRIFFCLFFCLTCPQILIYNLATLQFSGSEVWFGLHSDGEAVLYEPFDHIESDTKDA